MHYISNIHYCNINTYIDLILIVRVEWETYNKGRNSISLFVFHSSNIGIKRITIYSPIAHSVPIGINSINGII